MEGFAKFAQMLKRFLSSRALHLAASFTLGVMLLLGAHRAAADSTPTNFNDITQRARGQVVYFYAWGGSELYNNYISWAAGETFRLYGVRVKQVRLTDTAVAVNQILSDKQAGNNTAGTADVVWINGNNFKIMKDKDLLYGPFINRLPNYKWLAVANHPELLRDFTIAVDGLEMPWGRAYFVFVNDAATTPTPPRSAIELLQFAKQNPGQVSYPAPPDFTGVAFLKQLMLDLGNPRDFQLAFKDDNYARQKTKALWAYLDALHPYLWQQGKNFPKNESDMLKMFASKTLLLSFSYNAGVASAAIKQKLVPPSVQTYAWQRGILGNQHYLAIPFNAPHKEGAMVFINFLLSPVAQGKKTNPDFWGEPSVLDIAKLDAAARQDFLTNAGKNPVPPIAATILPEPNPAWTSFLEQEWKRRYYK